MDAGKDELILVDSEDNVIGSKTKEECHYKTPTLHRAFSIFLFNDKNELLITKRNNEKKTWPSFWSNTVCSHPRKGEEMNDAVKRRLKEELNIETPLKFLFKFEYEAQYNEEWGEKELDWVFIGRFNSTVTPDNNEISEYAWISTDELKKDIEENSDKYTPWFKLSLERVLENLDI
jgi:isopentenyl-diphosphate Delta-isomerase